MATASMETRLREVQAAVLVNVQQGLVMMQTMDWKALAEKINQTASGRSETGAVLLFLDYVATRSGSIESVFGKLFLALSGYNLVSLALKDKPLAVLKSAAGVSLQGADAEVIANFAMGALGASGLTAIGVAWDGPSNHPLSVISVGLTKFLLSFVLLNREVTSKDAAATAFLEFGRYHARTGLLMIAYAIVLIWRARSRLNAPKYIISLEKRLNDRLDQLVTVVKDQKSRLDAISPTPTTPKKY